MSLSFTTLSISMTWLQVCFKSCSYLCRTLSGVTLNGIMTSPIDMEFGKTVLLGASGVMAYVMCLPFGIQYLAGLATGLVLSDWLFISR